MRTYQDAVETGVEMFLVIEVLVNVWSDANSVT